MTTANLNTNANVIQRIIPLIFGELWERFSYYGAQNIIVLYLTTVFAFSDNQSYSIYGIYATLAFALPVIGGILADRILGYNKAILTGLCALIIGNLCLAIPNVNYFLLGLAISVCGTALYRPSVFSLIGTIYNKTNAKRETGFAYLYVGMNIGATMAPIVYGIAIKIWGWSYGFIIAAIGISLSALWFLRIYSRHFPGGLPPQVTTKDATSSWLTPNKIIYPALIIAIAAISAIFFHPRLLDSLFIVFLIGIGVALLAISFTYPRETRQRIYALILLSSFGIIFFAAGLQIGSSVNLFINREVQRIVFGYEIPAIAFTSLYPLFVIVMAPIVIGCWNRLAVYHKEPSAPLKISYALFLGCIAFLCFVAATLLHGHIQLVWIIIANLCLSSGEICLVPTIMATISRHAPQRLQGTLMGGWFFCISIGGYLSSLLARLNEHNFLSLAIPARYPLNPFTPTFMITAFILLLAALLILCLMHWFNKVLRH